MAERRSWKKAPVACGSEGRGIAIERVEPGARSAAGRVGLRPGIGAVLVRPTGVGVPSGGAESDPTVEVLLDIPSTSMGLEPVVMPTGGIQVVLAGRTSTRLVGDGVVGRPDANLTDRPANPSSDYFFCHENTEDGPTPSISITTL